MFVETAQLSTLSTYNMPLPSWTFSKRFLKQMKKNKYGDDMRNPEGVKAAQTRLASRSFSFTFQRRMKLMLLLIILY